MEVCDAVDSPSTVTDVGYSVQTYLTHSTAEACSRDGRSGPMLSEPGEERERGERGGGGRRGRVEAIVRLTSHLKTMTVLNDHSISHTEGDSN